MKTINGTVYFTAKETINIVGCTGDQMVYMLRKDKKREEKGEERRIPLPEKHGRFNYWPVSKITEILIGINEHDRTKVNNRKKERVKVKRLSTKAKRLSDEAYEKALHIRMSKKREEENKRTWNSK